MTEKIYVSGEDLWSYWNRHKPTLRACRVALFTNEENAIFLTDDTGDVVFSVDCCGETIETFRLEWPNAASMVKKYAELVNALRFEADDDDEAAAEWTGGQTSRLCKVMDSTEEWLEVLLGGELREYSINENDLEEIINVVGQYLSDYMGISIYFPTEEADGTITEFPFDNDDESEVKQ